MFQHLKKQTVELGKVATTSRLCFTWNNQNRNEDYWNTPIHQGKVGVYIKGQKWLKNMREVESFNLITNYAAYKDERQESWDLLYDFWNPSNQISATVFKPIQVNKEIGFNLCIFKLVK